MTLLFVCVPAVAIATCANVTQCRNTRIMVEPGACEDTLVTDAIPMAACHPFVTGA